MTVADLYVQLSLLPQTAIVHVRVGKDEMRPAESVHCGPGDRYVVIQDYPDPPPPPNVP